MKVGIIGRGMVGSTSAYAIMMTKVASEIVLIDANRDRAIARLVDVINRDNRAVLTISSFNENVEGISDVTLSLPCLIGGRGNLGSLPIKLNAEEKYLLQNSAIIIRNKLDEYEKK